MRLLGAEETMMTAIVRLDDAAKPPAPASHPLLPLVLNFICDDITAEQTLLVKALHICIQRKKPLGAAVVLDHPAIMTAPMAVLEPEALAAKEGGMRGLVPIVQIDLCDGKFVPTVTWPFHEKDAQSLDDILNEREEIGKSILNDQDPNPIACNERKRLLPEMENFSSSEHDVIPSDYHRGDRPKHDDVQKKIHRLSRACGTDKKP
jgi:hypothetical protein